MASEDAAGGVGWLRASAVSATDPVDHRLDTRSRDPGDDYLLALAASEHAVLVTGDTDLLELSERLPIHTPRSFLASLRT